MASHAPQSILFVTNNGSVMTSGYSSRLGKGQFGIVDKGLAPSALGNAVTNVLPTTPKDRLFELRLGAPNVDVNRSQSNKSWSSMPFKLSEVVDISVAAPTLGGTVDDFIIGYDGVNADTAIVLTNGDNEVIDITLSGEAIGMLGYADAKVTLKLYLEAPDVGDFTMHQIIEEAVERFKKMTLVGGVPVTNYIDILPVNSENPVAVTGLDQAFFTLTIFDEGNQSALGLVQASYPLYEVKRQMYEAGQSTYVLIAEVGAVIADFVQTSVALADADCDGEPEVTETDVTTEWIEGAACTAIAVDYTLQLADNKCGEDRLAELQAYYPDLTIAIDTATQVQTIDLAGTSGTANIIVNGVEYLATFNADLATTEQDFVTAHAAAILAATGATVTYAGGLITFTATSGAMPTLAVENVTTDLAGTVSAITQTGATTEGVACQTVYRTQVYTDLVCEECDPIFRDLFVSEAPAKFEMIDWVKEETVYSEDALMGIRVRGKFNIFSGTEEYRDEIPFLYSSTRISLANEAPGMVSESFNSGTNGRFAVKLLSIATEPEGLGKDLRDLEERTKVFFTNEQRHAGNNYGKLVLGEESLLKPITPYVVYSIRFRTNRFAQSFSGEVVENFNYMIAAEVGKTTALETLINVLATAAGLPTVAAY